MIRSPRYSRTSWQIRSNSIIPRIPETDRRQIPILLDSHACKILKTPYILVTVKVTSYSWHTITQNGGKMVEMWSYFGASTPELAPWASHELGGLAPHQCRWVGVVWAPHCRDLHDGLLAGFGCSSLTLRFSWTVTLIILGLGFLRAHLLRLCCTAAFPPIFLQLRKGPLWVYICARVGAFCLFVLANLSTTCACITGVS